MELTEKYTSYILEDHPILSGTICQLLQLEYVCLQVGLGLALPKY